MRLKITSYNKIGKYHDSSIVDTEDISMNVHEFKRIVANAVELKEYGIIVAKNLEGEMENTEITYRSSELEQYVEE